MATLITARDTRLSARVANFLAKRSSGTEDIAYRCCTTRATIRVELMRLKLKGLVEHDGRRPRTWKLAELKEQEAA